MRTLFLLNNSNSLQLYRKDSWFIVGLIPHSNKMAFQTERMHFSVLGWRACRVSLVFMLSFLLRWGGHLVHGCL